MNTHKLELIAKAQHLCLLLLLCLHLALGGVPGPCRHSVTQDHLLSLNRLSNVCYIKASLPQILELLRTHFNYVRNSDNRRYVNTLETVIYHLYSQGCVPEISEEFERNFSSSNIVTVTMPQLIVALMMAALSTEVYTTSNLKSTPYNEDQAIMKALRDLSHASVSPPAKNSGNLPADKIHATDGKFPRTGWWIQKVVLPRSIKKRQDVSSYNLNSFGLRYGK
ncbi:uncharacterized protein LOC120806932 isoform X3 [Xiphias gladius]|uniref:uncharacterized protein LOC120806932 isoform X3 n=1 Tax=Xiphias gladius TaxID=8245 RepID=UPI001A980EB2|nr:uncharacterized protein LOC120806932 isoform X3 [Xiphias gladius]